MCIVWLGITNGFHGERRVGEVKEMFEDYIFHGGDVGIAVDVIGAGDGGNRGCSATECVDF